MNVVDENYAYEVSEEISYRLYLPDNYDNRGIWPLILYLHGSGERGCDPKKLDDYGLTSYLRNRSAFPFIVLAPLCPENDVWDMHYKSIMTLLESVTAEYRVDHTRLYLTGMSLGGCGAWHFALFDSTRFAAIAPICGCVANPKAVRALSDVPVWVAHGTVDRAIPFEDAQRLVDILTPFNKRLRFEVFEGAGHEVCTLAYQNEELYEWLLQFSK